MIDATQKKLREAQFFYRLLYKENQEVVRNEPEAFQFYLSAFLSAARSVTFALQYEEKSKYDIWFPSWLANLGEEDHTLLNFLKEQRNYEQKKGGAEVNVAWEYIPMVEVAKDNQGHPPYGFNWVGPPGIPPLKVGIPVHSFELSSDQKKVASVCKRHLELLEDLVRSFCYAYP